MPFVIPRVLQPPFSFLDIVGQDVSDSIPAQGIGVDTGLASIVLNGLEVNDRFLINFWFEFSKATAAGQVLAQLVLSGSATLQFGNAANTIRMRSPVMQIGEVFAFCYMGMAVCTVAGNITINLTGSTGANGANTSIVPGYLEIWKFDSSGP